MLLWKFFTQTMLWNRTDREPVMSQGELPCGWEMQEIREKPVGFGRFNEDLVTPTDLVKQDQNFEPVPQPVE